MDSARIELAAGPIQRLEGVDRATGERFSEDHPRRLVQRGLELEALAAMGLAIEPEQVTALELALRKQLHAEAPALARLRLLAESPSD